MLKLGYKHGLFVTNARISPQAKREYLDNYGGLSLEFMDGESLADEVIANPLLRAVWVENGVVEQSNRAVRFPVIVRRHRDDAPIVPQKYFRSPDPEIPRQLLRERHSGFDFSIDIGRGEPERFDGYRAPANPSMEEGAMGSLTTTDITATGAIALTDIHQIAKDIGRAFVFWLGDRVDGFTVRVGSPELVPLHGAGRNGIDAAGLLVNDFTGFSVVKTPFECCEELSFFRVRRSENWTPEIDARVTQAEWIRIYSPRSRCCLSYEIESRSCVAFRIAIDTVRTIRRPGWSKSVFALVPRWRAWSHSIPEPDEKASWPWDGRMLCGWFHWTLLGGPVAIASASEEHSILSGPPEQEELARLGAVRKFVAGQRKWELIEPGRARHMVALIGSDPFPEDQSLRNRTAEAVHYTSTVPRPIDPGSRSFALCCAWIAKVSLSAIAPLIERSAILGLGAVDGTVSVTKFKRYLVVDAGLRLSDGTERSTQALLNGLAPRLEAWLKRTDRLLSASRATYEYWFERYNIMLGVPWQQSTKAYFWKWHEGQYVASGLAGDFEAGDS